MFANIGWGEMLVLVIAGLVILGPEFEDLRQPLAELQKLRGMTPRAAITKHLLDGDDSFLTGAFDEKQAHEQLPPTVSPPPQTPAPPKPTGTVFDPDAT